MAPPPISDEISGYAGTIAAWVSGVAVAVLSLWKTRLRVRHDNRDDHAEERGKRGDDAVFDNLRDEVERLGELVRKMSADFSAERAARYAAEDRAFNCERANRDLAARVSALELELNNLRGWAKP